MSKKELGLKKTLPVSLGCGLVLLLMSGLFSHDFWLVPQKFRMNPGETVSIAANTGMDFPNSLSAATPDRFDRFVLTGESMREDIKDYRVEGNSVISRVKLEKPGTYVVGVALKPNEIRMTAAEFNEYLQLDGLPGIYQLRKQQGILDKDAVEFYSKYPKTIVQVGGHLDETPTKPLGLILEIVPQVNPYRLKQGDKLEVAVLFRGNPLPDADIAWSYPGRGDKFAGSAKTDKRGKALIPLVQAGPYVIRLTHMEWVKLPTHEWESYWTSLTFEVLK
jgi:uncharacterized GH25 family protein